MIMMTSFFEYGVEKLLNFIFRQMKIHIPSLNKSNLIYSFDYQSQCDSPIIQLR